jgi:hypothetical protein
MRQTTRPSMLREDLQRLRLEHGARRVESVLVVLRDRARDRADRPRARSGAQRAGARPAGRNATGSRVVRP